MTIFTSVQKKKLWWLALTILLVKCSVIFSTPLMLQARETFEFNLGEKVNILSDKAFRKTKENEFEAVGNVVITHLKNAIYGEHAKLNFNNGNTEVEGAVRLISPGVTFYGTKMQYNFLTKETRLENARIHSDSFTIVGKSIYQNSPTVIIAEEAEYSTCKDCPESWSVYGKNIHVTLGKYVRIKHAFIKINGVITMYIPYLVFPIKQTRETGLLFPNLGYKTAEGFKYQQPFYWALSDYSDMTIVPSVYGMRGLGGEYQFRQNFGEKTWLNFNMQGIEDRIYAPYKLTMDQLG
jgi:LPS-assembly protein